MKFFELYGLVWNPLEEAVSIRSEPGMEMFDAKQFNKAINGYCYMEINDPMNAKNNVAQKVGGYQCQRIRQEFMNAYDIINKYNSFSSEFELSEQSVFAALVQNDKRSFIFDKEFRNAYHPQKVYKKHANGRGQYVMKRVPKQTEKNEVYEVIPISNAHINDDDDAKEKDVMKQGAVEKKLFSEYLKGKRAVVLRDVLNESEVLEPYFFGKGTK